MLYRVTCRSHFDVSFPRFPVDFCEFFFEFFSFGTKIGLFYSVCVFITAGPMIKLCAGGEGDSEGHVL